MHRVLHGLVTWISGFCLPLLGPSFANAQGESVPSGFEFQPVIVDVFEPGRPVGFAELPDGRFLIVERNTGAVRLHAVGAAIAPVIHAVPDVSIEAERGLLGIAVDPDWPTRPFVYMYYTHYTMATGNRARVAMFTAAGDLTDSTSTALSFTSSYHLLTDIRDDAAIHNGGTLRFGPDGMLYVSLGDDGDGCNSQDLTTLAGGILRLDVSAMPDTGAGPPPKADLAAPGNPFAGPDENERLMYLWGLRNPFRFTIDQLTGDLQIGDVGLVSWEEMNHIPFSSGGGQNGGWPHREGNVDPGLGRTCGLGNAFTAPSYAYAHGTVAAVTAGPRYRTAGTAESFPPEYDGIVFYHDFYQGWLRCLEFTGGAWVPAQPFPGQPTVANWGASFLYYADIQLGRDGALYLMRLIPTAGRPSGLYRIVPSSPVAAPVAAAADVGVRAAPNPAGPGQDVRFRWTAPAGTDARLRILDAAGRLVRAWPVAGRRSLTWPGVGAAGSSPSAGVYFYSLEEPGTPPRTGRIVRLR